jgi:hypothetical protein
MKNSQATLYCHLWSVWFCKSFSHFLISGKIFGKVVEYKTYNCYNFPTHAQFFTSLLLIPAYMFRPLRAIIRQSQLYMCWKIIAIINENARNITHKTYTLGSLQLLPERLLTLRRIQRDIIINVQTCA